MNILFPPAARAKGDVNDDVVADDHLCVRVSRKLFQQVPPHTATQQRSRVQVDYTPQHNCSSNQPIFTHAHVIEAARTLAPTQAASRDTDTSSIRGE